MDYFEVNVRGNSYLVQPYVENDKLLFTTDIDGQQVLFGGTGNGLEAIDPPDIDEDLLAEIASEIDRDMM